MGPSRRYHEPLLPCVEEHDDEDCSDCDSDGGTTADWSLTSSLLNSTESTTSSSSFYSSSPAMDDARAQRQREEMQDLLSLGSRTNNNVSSVRVVTPEKHKSPKKVKLETTSSYSPVRSNTLRHSTEYSKYFKMLDAGVPMGWVVKVCEVDRKDPSVLSLDPDLPLQSQVGSSSDEQPVMESLEESVDSVMEEQEEENLVVVSEAEIDIDDDCTNEDDVSTGEWKTADANGVVTPITPISESSDDCKIIAKVDEEEEEGDETSKQSQSNVHEDCNKDEKDNIHDANDSPVSPGRPTLETEENNLEASTEEATNDESSLHSDKMEQTMQATPDTEEKSVQESILYDFKSKQRDPLFVNHVPQDAMNRDFGVATTKQVDEDEGDSDDENDQGGGFLGFFGIGKKKKSSKKSQQKQETKPTPQEEEQSQEPSEEADKDDGSAEEGGEPRKESDCEAVEQAESESPILETSAPPSAGEVSPDDCLPEHSSDNDESDENDKEPSSPMTASVEQKTSLDALEDDTTLSSSPVQQSDQAIEFIHGGLPLGKDPVYAKYFLMLKAGVPMDRVSLIFELDGKDPSILQLDPKLPYASQVDSGEEKKKMKSDNTRIDEVATNELSSTEADDKGLATTEKPGKADNEKHDSCQVVANRRSQHDRESEDETKKVTVNANQNTSHGQLELPLCKDPAYARYFLMLKARVPIDRVRNVVELDGKDPSVLDLDPNRSYASQVNPVANKEVSKPSATEPDGSEDSSDDENMSKPMQTPPSVGDETATRLKEAGSLAVTDALDDMISPRSVMAQLELPESYVGAPPLHQSQMRQSLELLTSRAAPLSMPEDSVVSAQVTGRSEVAKANLNALFARRAAGVVQVPSVVPVSIETKQEQVRACVQPPTPTEGVEMALRDDPEYAKYFKMLQMKMPEEVVRHALKRDGKNPDILNLDPEKSLKSQQKVEVDKAEVPLKDDPEYTKYFKMLRAGLPENAVQHAMQRDGKDPEVLKLDPEKSLKSQQQEANDDASNDDVPLKDDPEYAKYFKMLKMKMPEGAVRNAMQRDGVDPEILNLDPEKSLKSQQEATNDDTTNDEVPLKDDPEYTKYFKMLKMKMPEGAIRNAMQRDGVDPEILNLDPEKSLKSQQEATNDDTSNDEVPLKDDPEYAKYFKMLKMKMPEGAVRNAMQRDGVDPEILNLDPEKSLKSQKGDKNRPVTTKDGKSDGKEKDESAADKTEKKEEKVVRKRLFWNSIDKSNLDGSLWADAQSGETMNLEGLEYDEDEFASLFTSTSAGKKTESKSKDVSTKQPKSKQTSVQLIDSRRQMNGSILLAKYKHDYTVLAEKMNRLESDGMDETELLALMQLLPTKDESLAIRSYLPPADASQSAKDDAVSKLGECEKYMASMLDVTNSKSKFECMLYRAQFDGSVTDLASEISALREALVCVRNSDKLARLMVFALRLGNTLNTGAAGKGVAAITLDSLLKLHEAKAFDKKTSVLHYLVSIIHKNDKGVLDVSEDLLPALKAERIDVDSLAKTLGDLQKGQKRLKDMAAEIEEESNNVGGEPSSMEKFVKEADSELKRLSGELDGAKAAFADLLKYFGEKQDMKVHEFFTTLTRFVAMFEGARADVKRMQETKERRERMAKAQRSKSTSDLMKESPSFANDRSAVLHEIIRVSSEKKLKTESTEDEKKNET